jgi:hypothetical protein
MHILVAGGHASDYFRSIAVSVALSAIFMWLALRRFAAREV